MTTSRYHRVVLKLSGEAFADQSIGFGIDAVVVQRGWERRARVVALGERRGPATEARALFEETASARRSVPRWEPLLFADDGDE